MIISVLAETRRSLLRDSSIVERSGKHPSDFVRQVICISALECHAGHSLFYQFRNATNAGTQHGRTQTQ